VLNLVLVIDVLEVLSEHQAAALVLSRLVLDRGLAHPCRDLLHARVEVGAAGRVRRVPVVRAEALQQQGHAVLAAVKV